jgi:hypothetical protein
VAESIAYARQGPALHQLAACLPISWC